MLSIRALRTLVLVLSLVAIPLRSFHDADALLVDAAPFRRTPQLASNHPRNHAFGTPGRVNNNLWGHALPHPNPNPIGNRPFPLFPPRSLTPRQKLLWWRRVALWLRRQRSTTPASATVPAVNPAVVGNNDAPAVPAKQPSRRQQPAAPAAVPAPSEPVKYETTPAKETEHTLVRRATIPYSSSTTFNPTTMLCLVNAVRAENNLPALALSADLINAAQLHSDDQADTATMSHSGSDGSSPSDRVSGTWFATGENIAYGSSTAEDCFNQWVGSPAHLDNILGEKFTHLGVAVSYDSNGTPYWTQVFGGDGKVGSHNYPICPASSARTKMYTDSDEWVEYVDPEAEQVYYYGDDYVEYDEDTWKHDDTYEVDE